MVNNISNKTYNLQQAVLGGIQDFSVRGAKYFQLPWLEMKDFYFSNL